MGDEHSLGPETRGTFKESRASVVRDAGDKILGLQTADHTLHNPNGSRFEIVRMRNRNHVVHRGKTSYALMLDNMFRNPAERGMINVCLF